MSTLPEARPSLGESLAVFLSVVSSLLVGLVLIVAPWPPLVPWWPSGLWESNYFLDSHPALRALLLNVFTRGAVTGLGLVNVLLALVEAYQYLADRVEHL